MIIIIHCNNLSFEASNQLERAFGKLEKVEDHYQVTVESADLEKIRALSHKLEIDINLIPDDFDPKQVKLFISDMDSTLIGIECIDEIADMLNLKPEVAAITEAAMRGELEFEGSLTKRVALLKDLETHHLETVYQDRLFLNPGAENWVAGLKERAIKFALVSGGFTFFTDRLKYELGLDYARANVLEIKNQKLTGKVTGAIIGAQAKADFLHELCHENDISPEQVIAIGDGANDLLMMREAGFNIAFHAKPAVQEQALAAFNYRGLDAALDFLNIKK